MPSTCRSAERGRLRRFSWTIAEMRGFVRLPQVGLRARGQQSIAPEGNYRLHLEFHPPLEAGTEVTVRYRFTIPALKVAN